MKAPTLLPLAALPGPAAVVRDGVVEAHNEKFAAWVRRTDVAGARIEELLAAHPAVTDLVDAARDDREIDVLIDADANGNRTFWNVHVAPFDGATLLFATDVTASSLASLAVQESQRELVGAAAHDLRGPLAAIKGWASVAARGTVASGEAFGVIGRQVDRMNALLGELIESARSESGELACDRAVVPLDELVKVAIESLPFADRVHLDGLTTRRVSVDRLEMEAVIQRLVSFFATAEGARVTIATERDGRDLRVIFGATPPPKTPSPNPFRSSRSPRRGAFGFRLAQQLAARNGARVWLEDQGEGVRAMIAIPEERRGAGKREDLDARTPARVLVAAADREFATRTTSILRLQGLETTFVVTGEGLWSALAAGGFDAVVVTGDLSGFGGLEGVKRTVSKKRSPALFVIANDAAESTALDGAEREGAAAILEQPVDWPHFLSLIRHACAARKDNAD